MGSLRDKIVRKASDSIFFKREESDSKSPGFFAMWLASLFTYIPFQTETRERNC